ncbi:transposase [Streptomyces sp. NPDC127051]|uniref:transposase n=1 Tax=Streptomyces sp. NPDC127051 TaxID=3347119 RepID=UPI0036629CFB
MHHRSCRTTPYPSRQFSNRVNKHSKATTTLKAPPVLVRVVEYRIDGQAEVIRLITSLMDQEKYPAAELAELYARRWEIELVFDETKTHQRDRPVLSSQTPDGIRQEIFAHLIVHHATRDLLVEAARIAQCTADRTSFTRALHVIRRSVIAPTSFLPRHADVTVALASPRSPEPCCPDGGRETARGSSNRASPRSPARPPMSPPANELVQRVLQAVSLSTCDLRRCWRPITRSVGGLNKFNEPLSS